eukprot:TRINITY_DN7326_c0_g1_i3.p1 TRINITY_DN7326_c0_g1~~TRINITY_DN7326_c0_g1_i3.p1  ORF type:complete len:629 (+),score=139.15 TRINITY_DN7326_c0_g1_i3:503-2389(+)
MSVLKIAPDFAQRSEVLYRLALVFGKSYQLDQAINYFKLAILESNDTPTIKRRMDILIKMGICYIEKKEYVEALRSFESALGLKDKDFRVLQHIAWCEFLLKRNSQTLDRINKAIAIKDTDGDSYYIKGRILLDMEDYSSASENFKKAILCNPNKAEYLASLAILNALNKDYKEAFDNFLKATQLAPNCPEIWFDIGLLYEAHQRYKEAQTAYQKATEIDPTFNEALIRNQILSNQPLPKSPPPQYLHPEFHVSDSMVPMKSFLANLKVKKAAEPCFDSATAMQPSVIIKSIFNHGMQANPCSLPTPSSESKFPAGKPTEEAKEEDKEHRGEAESGFAEKVSREGKSKEQKGIENVQSKMNITSTMQPEANITFQSASNPPATTSKSTAQSPAADASNPQFQFVPPITAEAPILQAQQMDILKKYAQLREQQLQFERMLRSCGIVPPSIDLSALLQNDKSPPAQPSFDTSQMMGRGQGSNEGLSIFKEFSPKVAQTYNSQTLPQINFGSTTPIRPVPSYGTSIHSQYEGRSEMREDCGVLRKPVAQHPNAGLLRPIPMLPHIDKHAELKASDGKKLGGAQEVRDDPRSSTMVKLNVPSQMTDVKNYRRDKERGDLEYVETQKKRQKNE